MKPTQQIRIELVLSIANSYVGFPGDLVIKNQRIRLPMQEMGWGGGGVSILEEDPLEKEMATHSIILAWKTPWTEEPSGLQSMGSQKVGHNWATNTTYRGKG